MNAQTTTPPLNTRLRVERALTCAGALLSAGLVVALAQTCQASVLKGERFRAEQRALASAPAVTRTVATVGRDVSEL